MILEDTGCFVTLLDPKDTHHALAQQWMHTQTEGWISTWLVITETYYFLANRVHNDAALGFLEEIDNGGIALWDIPAPQRPTFASYSASTNSSRWIKPMPRSCYLPSIWGTAASSPPTSVTLALTVGKAANRLPI